MGPRFCARQLRRQGVSQARTIYVANPTSAGPNPLDLHWQTDDWDPALRFWTLGWDPRLGVWLRGQDTSLPSILAACEFAQEHEKWRFNTDPALITRGWLTEADHLKWKTEFDPFILIEIHQLFDMMEDDRDRFMAEINVRRMVCPPTS